MKRTLTGIDAHTALLQAVLPEKTETYTPIKHVDVIKRMRKEISTSGFIITGEEYRATNDGQIALGTFKVNYKTDPDISLAAHFMNSYNKQYAFRFSLGGIVNEYDTHMILDDHAFGSYKRVHKGAADVLAEGKIREFIACCSKYWNDMITEKDKLKSRFISSSRIYTITGELYLQKILNTLQVNIVRDQIATRGMLNPASGVTAWDLYNVFGIALRESHPCDWMGAHEKMHAIFCREFLDFTVRTPHVMKPMTTTSGPLLGPSIGLPGTAIAAYPTGSIGLSGISTAMFTSERGLRFIDAKDYEKAPDHD